VSADGIFVTGTGTEVGKSVVSAVIARTAAAAGSRVAVFKPAVTGLEDEGEGDHELLKRASGSEQAKAEIAPYRYAPAVSPHLAAELAGEEIDRERLLTAARVAADGADAIVCEGVGGLMVPLAREYLVRNLAAELGYPVVIAASPGLGTINHTLQTIEAAWAAEIEVRAVVLTPWPAEPSRMELSNRDTVALLGGVDVEVLPEIDLADPEGWPPLDLL